MMFKSISRQGRIRAHVASSRSLGRISVPLGLSNNHQEYDSVGQYGRWAAGLSVICHFLIFLLPVSHGHLNGFGKPAATGPKALVLSLQPSVRLHLLIERPHYQPAVYTHRPGAVSPSLPESAGYTASLDRNVEDKPADSTSGMASAPVSESEPDVLQIEHNADGSIKWGADIYYSAPQLDQLAEAASTVVLPEFAQAAPSVQMSDNIAPNSPVLRLLVFINENGAVDGVQVVESGTPEVTAAVMNIFRQALFLPARRQGRPVKSVKQISVFPPGQ